MNVAKVIDLNPYGEQGERQQRKTVGLHDAIAGFQNAMAEAGLGRPEVEADGKIHRFSLPDEKGNNKSGWYLLYADNIPAGQFGNWKDDFSQTWHAYIGRQYEISQEEMDQITERQRKAGLARDEARRAEADLAASKATEILAAAPVAADDHPYLTKKQVKAFDLRVGERNALLVPMYNAYGETRGLQRIFPDGTKLFYKGVNPKGLFHVIDGDQSTMYLCEGYATGASIHMATGQAVIIAFNCGNLEPVAVASKEVFPQAKIVIAADDDRWTTRTDGSPHNPGAEHAKAVAARHGFQVVSPSFRDLSSRPTDFNDLHVREGLEEVRQQLGGAEYAFISMADIEAMEFEERPVIEGLLDETENLVVIGPSNIGKSLLTLHIAMAVADPEIANIGGLNLNHKPRLFGKFPIAAPRRVLFLQSENTAKATHKRMKKMLQGKPELRRSLTSIVMPTVDKNQNEVRIHGPINSTFYDTARTLIRKARADVVIIDPLISFHDADENDNVAMRAALDRFNDLSRSVGCSLIIIHHTGKDEDRGGRGASAIKDWYDNALIITKASSGQDRFVIKITHDKSRNYEVKGPFYLERNKSLDFEPVDNPELYLAYEAVNEAGGLLTGTKDLIEAMKGISGDEKSDRTWERIIAQALREKIIAKEKAGKSVTYYIESN